MNYKFILFSLLILCLYQNIDAQRLESSDCKCRLLANRRIVGGREVKKHIPWMVSLAFWSDQSGSYEHFCGGTIINRRWILTAAHCPISVIKYGNDIKKIQVRVGMVELNQTDNVQLFGVKKFLIDNRYKKGGIASQIGDIGFIEINGNIQFSKTVQPACFPETDAYESYADKIGSLHAVGFGYTKSYLFETGSHIITTPVELSNRLKEAFFNDQSAEKKGCFDYLICLKPVKHPDSTCDGDSGSGLMHQTPKGLTKVVGISSFIWYRSYNVRLTKACIGESGFSRISTYKTFFDKTVDNDYCKIA